MAAEADARIARMFSDRISMTRDELYRAAMADGASIEFVTDMYLLPDGFYGPSDVRGTIRDEG